MPLAVAKFTVTGLSAVAESVIGNEKVVVVPAFPSFFETPKITTLHWSLRSCRWFLSPQPLPGFVEVGVVVEVEVDVLVEVEVDVEVIVEVEVVVGVVVVLVIVEVEVVVGVVVVLVTVEVEVLVGVVVDVVDVLVEQYWYCEGVVQY